MANVDEEFKVNLDVAHFKPEEIQVKTVDNKVVISAKHEERQDEHGFIMREFKRSYMLPKVCIQKAIILLWIAWQICYHPFVCVYVQVLQFVSIIIMDRRSRLLLK